MHARNAETVFELHPYIGAQADAQNARHIMRAVALALRLGQQIAQQFTDINSGGRLEFNAIFPELTGRKLAPQCQCRAAAQARSKPTTNALEW